MISEKAMDYVITLVENSGKSYETIADACNLSKSTISRLVSKRQATMYTLDQLIAYFERGKDWKEIVGEDKSHSCPLVADVRNELQAIETVYAEREKRILQQCDERVESLRGQLAMLQNHHNQALQKRDETYERSVEYLKSQVTIMRSERSELQKELDKQTKRADRLDEKQHNVFWGMLALLFLMLLAFFAALFSDAVV